MYQRTNKPSYISNIPGCLPLQSILLPLALSRLIMTRAKLNIYYRIVFSRPKGVVSTSLPPYLPVPQNLAAGGSYCPPTVLPHYIAMVLWFCSDCGKFIGHYAPNVDAVEWLANTLHTWVSRWVLM